jgi:predicted acetyltransferase
MADNDDVIAAEDQPQQQRPSRSGGGKLQLPQIYETKDGYFQVEGLGANKYTLEDAKRVAKQVAIQRRAETGNNG